MSVEPRTAPSTQNPDSPLIGTGPAAGANGSSSATRPSPWIIWLWRIRALLFVTVCATFGVLLVILPWTPKWTDNPLLLMHPGLRSAVASGFFRGLASGLGVLDLWLGFWEAIHYHEAPKQSG